MESKTQALVVDEALTRKVANLAKISLSDEEVALFTPQLNHVLGYIHKLNEVSLVRMSGPEKGQEVEPLTHGLVYGTVPGVESIEKNSQTRPDKVRADAHSVSVLDCAPEVQEGGFKVPQVI
jgi:aspartyl-tRNA(Asn)/glutamyl-tRNA(Gln) amidotransferase subunit C